MDKQAEDKKPIVPKTDPVMDVEGTWFYFYVEAGGHVYVLATGMQDAEKIIRARYPDKAFTGGISKRRPASGESYLKQVPVVQYSEKANPKDIDEMKRRDGVNYEYTSR